MRVEIAVLLILSGCQPVQVYNNGRPCQNGECLAGYTCDRSSGICITEGDDCDTPGATSACDYHATDCLEGCRVCERGSWSECRVLGDECSPGIPICEGETLVSCDDTGFVTETSACGVAGCNPVATPQRCNLCAPNTSWCDGGAFHECDTYGLPGDITNCSSSPGTCASGGDCDDEDGCGFVGVSDDGVPCDEGLGADGNWCNSACAAGVCVPAAVECDDLNECTVEACNPVTGCIHVPEPEGTPCPGADQDLCTSTCDDAGSCTAPGVDCSDGNPCTRDQCADGVCANPPGNNGVICRIGTDACDAAERCTGLSAVCPADVDVITLSAPASVALRQWVDVTVTLPCPGETASLSCTTTSARFCVDGPLPFEGAQNGMVGTGVSNVDCGADGIPASNCLNNDGGGDVLRLANTGTIAQRNHTVDASAFTNLRLHLKAAFNGTTDVGEVASVRACCGAACTPAQIGTINSVDDNGVDGWTERPCRVDNCPGFGWSVGTDNCAQLLTAVYWWATGTDEPLHLDDHTISGVAQLDLPLTDVGGGTYTTRYRPCNTGAVTVTCTWDYGAGITEVVTTTVN